MGCGEGKTAQSYLTSKYKITVEEYYQDKTHPDNKRFHNLRYIEKVADLPGGRYNGTSRSGVSTNGESATGYNVADVYRFVKQYDRDWPTRRCTRKVR